MEQQNQNSVAEVESAQKALRSLASCAVQIDISTLKQWFVHAFNYWYCPIVRRGYHIAMAHVFDLGMVLCNPLVMIRRWTTSEQGNPRREYIDLIEYLRQSPLMIIARDILAKAEDNGNKKEVERLIIESMAREFVWHKGEKSFSSYLEQSVDGETITIAVYKDKNKSGGQIGKFLLSLPVGDAADAYPCLTENKKVAQIPNRICLFVANVAAQASNAQFRLDYEVIEACLLGPNMRSLQHDPPPLHQTVTVKHTRSTLPGTNAGVTRAEVKLPEDPPINILPSELAQVKVWERAETLNRQHNKSELYMKQRQNRALFSLADILLNRKPLVYKRENPNDLVPRHRALVCFVVGAGAEGPPDFVGGPVHAYRHAYVYAKRQTFDLIRDLREALEKVRRYAFVDVDVAVFGFSQNQNDAIVHSKFKLEKMPLRGMGEAIGDRLRQAMAFNYLAPKFFDRLLSEGRDRYQLGRVPANISVFLRNEAKSARPYHAVHLVLIASLNELPAFITLVGRDIRPRQYLTLIGIDLMSPDTGQRIEIKGEPAWSYNRARTASEVGLFSREQLSRISLEVLRRKFVESVMGPARHKNSVLRNLVYDAARARINTY